MGGAWYLVSVMEDAHYEALLARDPRFDGKFFVGVKTTGIYCRPVCPARPLRKNVEFFPSAAAAERAGYRPCRRCHPQAAPDSPAWHGQLAAVQAALRRIAAHELFDLSEDAFAARLGLTARHLRRLFAAELGQTPRQIAHAHRLRFAHQLVAETRLPLTAVALTARFASVRRFNAAFRARFGQAPSTLRRGRRAPSAPTGAVDLTLPFRPPYDWAAIHAFYAAHAIPGVEHVPPTHYERVFSLGGVTGLLQVMPAPDRPALVEPRPLVGTAVVQAVPAPAAATAVVR